MKTEKRAAAARKDQEGGEKHSTGQSREEDEGTKGTTEIKDEGLRYRTKEIVSR